MSTRDRTVAELRSCLERKRVEPEAIEHAVSELTAAGYLDDARFATRFAEDKRTLERWGSERIARDLHRRGVPPDLVEAAVSTQEHDQELLAAIDLLAERVPVPPVGDRERHRAWQLLVRKGYGPDVAYEAVRAHGGQAAA